MTLFNVIHSRGVMMMMMMVPSGYEEEMLSHFL
jgi:hypothetical protein